MDTRMLKRILLGLVLVGLGGLFFAAELGYINLSVGQLIGTYWPVALLYVGLSGLIDNWRPDRRSSGSAFWSFFILMLGGVFLARNLGLTRLSIGDFVQLMIPAAIILIGIRMMFKRSKIAAEPKKEQEREQPYKYEYKYEFNPGPQSPYFPDEDPVPPPAPGPTPGPDPAHGEKPKYDVPPPRSSGCRKSRSNWQCDYDGKTENRSGFMGDLFLGQDQWELRPMNISHFIGDTIIDLTRAHIPYGETKLNVSTFIGDVKVFAPSDIDLEISVTSSSFIGDIEVFERSENGMLRSVHYESTEYAAAEKRIKLIVNMFIGDVSIKRVG